MNQYFGKMLKQNIADVKYKIRKKKVLNISTFFLFIPRAKRDEKNLKIFTFYVNNGIIYVR